CRGMWKPLSAASLVFAALVTGAQPARTPVVVELFTSEGCSSCPPADDVLSKLAREGAVGGAQVIPLGLHVTYWDQLGWKDPASLHASTDRQQDYGRIFGADSLYTPQAVIDGRAQLVGSDEAGVRRAIAKAAVEPHGTVQLSASVKSDVVVAKASVDGIRANEPLHNVFFITEDGLTSIVKRGENGGRTLHNDAGARGHSLGEGVGQRGARARPGPLPPSVILRGRADAGPATR